ncbi:hypothetical protein [Saccharothrix variisporea]|uniref:Uncharacterized protein n=1 Tax=Saccharothrix variisporea TaxID=543527 RepID=A0A495WZN8_9PSEU|nr:hypothetical protein [Saccharothrix variisporea]RKT67107.1 hypothetical protein DFJ66_0275 [Saccharothrix variisporea]
MTSYLRAKTGFMVPAPSGQTRGAVIKGGQVVRADDPVVEGREALFVPVDDGIEQATRAPGEKRLLQRTDRSTVVIAAADKPKRQRAARRDDQAGTAADG